MNPRVKHVIANLDYTLTLTFDNNEVKIFDMKPYLNKGIFKELRDMGLFKSVKPFLGSVQWKNGQDLCPDTLYLDSKKAEQVNAPDFTQLAVILESPCNMGVIGDFFTQRTYMNEPIIHIKEIVPVAKDIVPAFAAIVIEKDKYLKELMSIIADIEAELRPHIIQYHR